MDKDTEYLDTPRREHRPDVGHVWVFDSKFIPCGPNGWIDADVADPPEEMQCHVQLANDMYDTMRYTGVWTSFMPVVKWKPLIRPVTHQERYGLQDDGTVMDREVGRMLIGPQASFTQEQREVIVEALNDHE